MRPRAHRGVIGLKNEREKCALQIVADGAIARGDVGEGRLIPLVILDTAKRPDLEEYIRLHQFVRSGDLTTQWGQLDEHKDAVVLILSLVNPAEMVAIIEFDLEKSHGILVEQALSTKALYIQAGRQGDRLKQDLSVPKVIVELPDTGFRVFWDQIQLRHVTAKMKRAGMGRADAKRAAKQFVEEIRRVAAYRLSGH
jgi:hypothetical protein